MRTACARERFIENLAATAPYTLYLYDVPAEEIDYVTANASALQSTDNGQVRDNMAACAADPKHMHPEDRIRYAQHLSDLMAAPDGTVLTFQYRDMTPNEAASAGEETQWRWCERQERV